MERMMPGKTRAAAVRIFAAALISLVAGACDTMVNRETEQALREYEQKIYVMKNTVTANDEKLVKGQKVKIKVFWGKDWIKIRGYAADVDPLHAEQVLMLYMFKSDFPEDRFSMETLQEKFGEIAQTARQ